MRTPKVLIIGSSGQDGPILANQYLQLNWDVYCISRSESTRISKIRVNQEQLDLNSGQSLKNRIISIRPDVIINLASKSSVAYCETNTSESFETNFRLVERLVEDVQIAATNLKKEIKFIQASSSEMFGEQEFPCDEETKMSPISTYGKHKFLAHKLVTNQHHELVKFHSAILFNHESEYRPDIFVSSKVARAAAEVKLFGFTNIEFGSIDNKRDWGYAPDYMEAIVAISQFSQAKSYVIGSGLLHSVREMLIAAFEHIGTPNYMDYVRISEQFVRSINPKPVVSDPRKIYDDLGWVSKVKFESLVTKLVDAKIAELTRN